MISGLSILVANYKKVTTTVVGYLGSGWLAIIVTDSFSVGRLKVRIDELALIRRLVSSWVGATVSCVR